MYEKIGPFCLRFYHKVTLRVLLVHLFLLLLLLLLLLRSSLTSLTPSPDPPLHLHHQTTAFILPHPPSSYNSPPSSPLSSPLVISFLISSFSIYPRLATFETHLCFSQLSLTAHSLPYISLTGLYYFVDDVVTDMIVQIVLLNLSTRLFITKSVAVRLD